MPFCDFYQIISSAYISLLFTYTKGQSPPKLLLLQCCLLVLLIIHVLVLVRNTGRGWECMKSDFLLVWILHLFHRSTISPHTHQLSLSLILCSLFLIFSLTPWELDPPCVIGSSCSCSHINPSCCSWTADHRWFQHITTTTMACDGQCRDYAVLMALLSQVHLVVLYWSVCLCFFCIHHPYVEVIHHQCSTVSLRWRSSTMYQALPLYLVFTCFEEKVLTCSPVLCVVLYSTL